MRWMYEILLIKVYCSIFVCSLLNVEHNLHVKIVNWYGEIYLYLSHNLTFIETYLSNRTARMSERKINLRERSINRNQEKKSNHTIDHACKSLLAEKQMIKNNHDIVSSSSIILDWFLSHLSSPVLVHCNTRAISSGNKKYTDSMSIIRK